MEEGGAREVGAETAETLSHGNCKCNHWNKNWLSSDVKRRVGAGGSGTVEEAEGDRREKYT